MAFVSGFCGCEPSVNTRVEEASSFSALMSLTTSCTQARKSSDFRSFFSGFSLLGRQICLGNCVMMEVEGWHEGCKGL